jgi:hypothetical protein
MLEGQLDFQRTTRCYIPEDRTLHNHRYEELKSYILCIFFFFYRLYSPFGPWSLLFSFMIILHTVGLLGDRLYVPVFRVPGYRSRGSGFDSRRYQIF